MRWMVVNVGLFKLWGCLRGVYYWYREELYTIIHSYQMRQILMLRILLSTKVIHEVGKF